MRIVQAFAVLCCCLPWAALDAIAQEEGQKSDAPEGGAAEESDDAAAQARRQRMLQGNVAKMELDGGTIAISYGDTPTDSPDYPQLETIAEGGVVTLTGSIVTKLKTDLDLKFGDTIIKTGNASKDYPGVYGLWLKRTGDGWHLVFNEYADVWGTQYFSEADVAEVPLTYAKADESVEAYSVKFVEAEDGGAIEIAWGEYRWTTAFTVAR